MIVGICGNIGSGKTYITSILTNDYGFTKYEMAKPLKEIAAVIGFEHHQLWGTQEQKLEINKYWKVSAREFLQKFGTEVCREFLPQVMGKFSDIWVKCMIRELSNLENKGRNYVIEGIRYQDEADAIYQMGGLVIKIKPIPPAFINSNGDPSDLGDQKYNVVMHKSEQSLDKITPVTTVINNYTSEFIDKVIKILELPEKNATPLPTTSVVGIDFVYTSTVLAIIAVGVLYFIW